MEGKTIYKNMDMGKLFVRDGSNVILDEKSKDGRVWKSTRELCRPYGITKANQQANAAAIVSAVNNTWGRNIDPSQVPAMHKMFQEISAWLSMNTAPNANELRDMKADIDKLLQSATI